jgi:hypothetical protein
VHLSITDSPPPPSTPNRSRSGSPSSPRRLKDLPAIAKVLSSPKLDPEQKQILENQLDSPPSFARVLFTEQPPPTVNEARSPFEVDPLVDISSSSEEEDHFHTPVSTPTRQRSRIPIRPLPPVNVLQQYRQETEAREKRQTEEANNWFNFDYILPLEYPEGPQFQQEFRVYRPELTFHPQTQHQRSIPLEIMQPPTFDGSDRINDSVNDFLRDLESFFAIHDTPIERQLIIVPTRLRGMASDMFDVAVAEGNVVLPQPEDGETAAERTQRCEGCVIAIRTWLRNTFYGREEQESVKRALTDVRERDHESPRQFHQRVSSMLSKAGYPEAVKDHLLEQHFVMGLRPSIANHVRLHAGDDLDDKIEAAQKYWQLTFQNEQPVFEPPSETQNRTLNKSQIKNNQVIKDTTLEKQVDELTQELAKLRILVANQGRPAKQPSYRQFGRPENIKTNNACFRCGEVGHFASECMTETEKRAQGRRQATNVATIRQHQVFSDDSEEDDENEEKEGFTRVEAYPAVAKPREKTSPYTRQSRHSKRTQQAHPENNINPDMEIVLDDEPVPNVREVPKSESIKETTQRQRQVRQHDTNFWDEIKDMPVTMPLQKILNISPQARTQLRAGLQPKHQANAASTQDDEEQEQMSAAYLTITIDGKPLTAVVDTGASIPIMTKSAVERLGYQIERPSNAVIVTANNQDVPILGEIDDITIHIGEASFSSTFMIIPDGDYDILLSLRLLQKMKAKIDTNNSTMEFTCKGRTYEVDLNCHRPSTIRRHEVNNAGWRLSTEEQRKSVDSWQAFARNPPAFPKEIRHESTYKIPELIEVSDIRLATELEYIQETVDKYLKDDRVRKEITYLAGAIHEVRHMATEITLLAEALDKREARITRKNAPVVQFSIPQFIAQQEVDNEDESVPENWEERNEDESQDDSSPEEMAEEEDDTYPPNIFWDVSSREQKESYQWQLRNRRIPLKNGIDIDPNRHNQQNWTRKNRFRSAIVKKEFPIWYYNGRTYERDERCSSTHCARTVEYEVSVVCRDDPNETEEHGVCHVCAADWTCLGNKIIKHIVWGTWDNTCREIANRAAKENALAESSPFPEEIIEMIGNATARIATGLQPTLREERQRQKYPVNMIGIQQRNPQRLQQLQQLKD